MSIVSTPDDIQYSEDMTVSWKDVSLLTSQLECGKSAGSDGVCAETIKCTQNRIAIFLSLLFTLCLSHGYHPPAIIETTIVPIVNNKCSNITDSNNYRPIALATIVSKLFESVLLIKCEQYLTTSANQFGFKTGHSTDLCIYALNEFIEYYKSRNTTVFVTFLDASKSFDRIDHWLLFKKLISKDVPLFIIRLLAYWYSHQKMCVRWGNKVFSFFMCVSNGVKQGGILSPTLFNVYMDSLSTSLNSTNIGGILVANF